MKTLSKWNISFSAICLVYICTHALMILNCGVWWDDSTVWNVTPDSLYAYLGPNDANEIVQYSFINYVTSHFTLAHQIYVFRICVLLLNLCSLICCWFIIKLLTKSYEITVLTSLLMAAFGLDSTSMLIICTHYAGANCFFLIGLVLLIYENTNSNRWIVFVSAILWFISLVIWRSAALLMPLVVIILSCRKTGWTIFKAKSYKLAFEYAIKHYWPIIIMCVMFVVIYLNFMTQQGPHAGYYKPQVNNLTWIPLTASLSVLTSILQYFSLSLSAFSGDASVILIIVSCSLFCCVYCCLRNYTNYTESVGENILWYAVLYLGVSFILPLSIFEKGSMVDVSEYTSRVLSLSAMPIAIISVYAIEKITNSKFRKVVFSILLVGSCMYTINTSVDYGVALAKRDYFVKYFQEHPELDGSHILIKDYSFATNPNESPIRYYDYEGMARSAYGPSTSTKIRSIYSCPDSIENYNFELMLTQNYYSMRQQDKDWLFISRIFFHRKYNRLLNEFYDIQLKKM